MKAVILLRTNPGNQKQAYSVLKGFLKKTPLKGVEIISITHCFGRFDGVLMCESENTTGLNALAENLREGGVFHTETLIAID